MKIEEEVSKSLIVSNKKGRIHPAFFPQILP